MAGLLDAPSNDHLIGAVTGALRIENNPGCVLRQVTVTAADVKTDLLPELALACADALQQGSLAR